MEIATWVIELGVGLACLTGGAIALRTPRLRLVGVLLVVAGAAAAVHAVFRLATS